MVSELRSPVPQSTFAQWLQRRLGQYQMLVFVLMLATLYLMLWEPIGSAGMRSYFVLHLGLFILWQPIIEGQSRLSSSTLLLFGSSIVAATVAVDGWVLCLWIMLLSGIVGGRVVLAGSTRMRMAYLFALAFLVIALLLFAVPIAVPTATVPAAFQWLGRAGLPLILVLVLTLSRRAMAGASAEVVDLINSLFVFLLLAVLVLGSLAAMLLFKLTYAEALLDTLFTLGGVLLVFGWIWSPHFGFSGVQNFVSRYLLSVGMPAQQWLESLANLTQREEDPERFLRAACEDMLVRLSWIRGLEWRTTDDTNAVGTVGDPTGVSSRFEQEGLVLTFRTRFSLPPSVVWHLNLLAQLLAEFYADKRRARVLRELSFLSAVHETGARLTHDVKNLLQSLQTLIYAVDQTDRAGDDVRDLIRRQLPAITTRLATTLDKLRAPQLATERNDIPVGEWWARLTQRYAAETWIKFEPLIVGPSLPVPPGVFTSVADNLLANIAEKRAREPALTAHVSLEPEAGCVTLMVCDDGSAVPEALLRDLLRRPVKSKTGLGIGLYQVSQRAEEAGYQLYLAKNRPGAVCFGLRRLAASESQS